MTMPPMPPPDANATPMYSDAASGKCAATRTVLGTKMRPWHKPSPIPWAKINCQYLVADAMENRQRV
jgi:hypothetical protein